MKDEYLKAYQQKIEEIKTLDVSPEEKRKLAADAKNEILEQYKTSYIKEKENTAKKEQAPKETKQTNGDEIGNILTKLEEREERGEVGIDLETPTEFIDPDALFSTMNLDELFSTLGIEDDGVELEQVEGDDEIHSFDELFMDSDELFAGLLDEVEEEVETEDILNEFDLDETTQPLEPNAALDSDVTELVNVINNEEPSEDFDVGVEDVTTQLEEVEITVDEVEELTEGAIIDESEEELDNEDLDDEGISELEELEKERQRAQKLGAIELALLIVLIILVIIVVYLIIGV